MLVHKTMPVFSRQFSLKKVWFIAEGNVFVLVNQHGCRDVRCRPAMPTVHVIVHDRSNRRRIDAKVNGLDFSTVGVLYFLTYITLENVSEKKKCHYHLKNVFIVSLSASTYDWFTGYFLPVSDWSQTSKQTKPIPVIYRCFICYGFGETNHYTLFSHQNFCFICQENICLWRMSNYILMIRDIIITGLFLITATN